MIELSCLQRSNGVPDAVRLHERAGELVAGRTLFTYTLPLIVPLLCCTLNRAASAGHDLDVRRIAGADLHQVLHP